MSHKIDAVILAGGNSTRFRKLKQITEIDKSGNTIIDFSITDLKSIGINNVYIVCNDRSFSYFFKKYADDTSVIILNQRQEGQDENSALPYGVGHALYVGTLNIMNPFIMLNGDDYYNLDSLRMCFDFLMRNFNDSCLVCFTLDNTLNINSALKVNRGIIKGSSSNFLEDIVILSDVIYSNGIVTGSIKGKMQKLTGKETTNMNLYGFSDGFIKFLREHVRNQLNTGNKNISKEIFVHDLINNLIRSNKMKFHVLLSESKCVGLTNPEDLYFVEQFFNKIDGDK